MLSVSTEAVGELVNQRVQQTRDPLEAFVTAVTPEPTLTVEWVDHVDSHDATVVRSFFVDTLGESCTTSVSVNHDVELTLFASRCSSGRRQQPPGCPLTWSLQSRTCGTAARGMPSDYLLPL